MIDPFLDELEAQLPEEEKRLIEKQIDIAVQLDEYIKEMGIAKKEFAERLGWQPSYLSRVLAGGTNLTLKTIAKLEAVLQRDLIVTPLVYESEYTPHVEASSDQMLSVPLIGLMMIPVTPQLQLSRIAMSTSWKRASVVTANYQEEAA